MNNLHGWEPEPYYNLTEVENLSAMPKSLKTKIRKTWSKNCEGKGPEKEGQCPQLRMVWASCEGDTPADQEFMGPLKYMPMHGFPGYYFPFLNQQFYRNPVVWLQFRDLTPGVLINVSCRLWAKNIQHSESNSRIGGVHFELLME